MKKIVIFITYAYPSRERFFEILQLLNEVGIDVVEIGIPVEQANLDGEIIQECNKVVLNSGFTFEILHTDFKRIASEFRFKKVIMTYHDAFSKYDLLKLKDLVDGYLCADKTQIKIPKQIHIFNEKMSIKELEEKLNEHSLFAYVMSGIGVTGSFKTVPSHYIHTVEEIRKLSDIPCYIGFGIKTKEDVKNVLDHGGDGAIIGSSFLKRIRDNQTNEELKEYLSNLLCVCKEFK